nr:unnamed protein product [Spirometra erinaceieuropaei]
MVETAKTETTPISLFLFLPILLLLSLLLLLLLLLAASIGRLTVRRETDRNGRIVLVARELVCYKEDFAALNETRFSEQGQLEEVGAGYTFFWSGRSRAERRDADVAFAIRNDIVGRLPCVPQGINDCLMSPRKPLWGGKFTTIINVNGRLMTSPDDASGKF